VPTESLNESITPLGHTTYNSLVAVSMARAQYFRDRKMSHRAVARVAPYASKKYDNHVPRAYLRSRFLKPLGIRIGRVSFLAPIHFTDISLCPNCHCQWWTMPIFCDEVTRITVFVSLESFYCCLILNTETSIWKHVYYLHTFTPGSDAKSSRGCPIRRISNAIIFC